MEVRVSARAGAGQEDGASSSNEPAGGSKINNTWEETGCLKFNLYGKKIPGGWPGLPWRGERCGKDRRGEAERSEAAAITKAAGRWVVCRLQTPRAGAWFGLWPVAFLHDVIKPVEEIGSNPAKGLLASSGFAPRGRSSCPRKAS